MSKAVYAWSVTSPATITSRQGTNSIQVSSTGGSSSAFTVSVIVGGCEIATLSKNIAPITISNLTIQEFPNYYDINACPGTMQVTPNSGSYFDNLSAYHSVFIPTGGTNSTKYAALTFTDFCGTTYGTFILYQQCSGYNTNAVRYYPNPASTVLNIVYGADVKSTDVTTDATPAQTIEQAYAQYVQEHPNVKMAPLDPLMVQQAHDLDNATIVIKLYNSLGIAVINLTRLLSTNSTALDTSTLPNGTYFLHTTVKGLTEKKQIIISH